MCNAGARGEPRDKSTGAPGQEVEDRLTIAGTGCHGPLWQARHQKQYVVFRGEG